MLCSYDCEQIKLWDAVSNDSLSLFFLSDFLAIMSVLLLPYKIYCIGGFIEIS